MVAESTKKLYLLSAADFWDLKLLQYPPKNVKVQLCFKFCLLLKHTVYKIWEMFNFHLNHRRFWPAAKL